MKVFAILSKKHGTIEVLVDDEDFDYLVRFSWHVNKINGHFYVRRSEGSQSRGTRKFFWLHRSLVNAPVGFDVDHIDHNTLNNQKSNLRVCSRTENTRNRKKRTDDLTSRFKGVKYHKGRWYSQIRIDGKMKHLGIFMDEEDAARAYDQSARKCFGQFACLNFPEGSEQCAIKMESMSQHVT